MSKFLDLITFYDKDGNLQTVATQTDILNVKSEVEGDVNSRISDMNTSLMEHINMTAASKQDVIHGNLSLSYHDDSVSFGFNDSDGRAGVFLSSSSSNGSEGPLTIRNNNGSIVLETNSGDVGESGVSIMCEGRSYLSIYANNRDSEYTVNCNGTWMFSDGELKMGDSIVATRDWVQQNVSGGTEIGDSLSVGTLELSGYESYAQITSGNEMNIGAGSIKLESPSGSKFLVNNYIDLNTPDKVVITTGDYTIFGDPSQSLYYTAITSSKDKFEIVSDRYGDDYSNRGSNQIAFNENGIDIINSISGYSSSYDNNAIRSDINIKQTGGYGGINIASEYDDYGYVNMTCGTGTSKFGVNMKSEWGARSVSAQIGSNGMIITDGISGSYNGTTFTGNVKFTGNVEGISGGSGGSSEPVEYYVFGVNTLPDYTFWNLNEEQLALTEVASFKIIVPSNVEFTDNVLNDWWDVVKNYMGMGQSFYEFEDSMTYNEIANAKGELAMYSSYTFANKFFHNLFKYYSYFNLFETKPSSLIYDFKPFCANSEYSSEKDGNIVRLSLIDDASTICSDPYIINEYGGNYVTIAYSQINYDAELDTPSDIWQMNNTKTVVGSFYSEYYYKTNDAYLYNDTGVYNICPGNIIYLGKL